MNGRTVALFIGMALVVGLVAGLLFATLRQSEPTSVPAILLDAGPPSGAGGDDPRDGGPGGEKRQERGDHNRTSGDGQPMSGDSTPAGAQPAPAAPPAPAGLRDDDDPQEPGDGGSDHAGDDRAD